MHRKKTVNVLAILTSPKWMSLSDVEGENEVRMSNPASSLLSLLSTPHAEQQESALQCERKNNFFRAAHLMFESLQVRAQLDLPGSSECNARFCQVLHSWVYHFVKEGQLDRAFDLFRVLSQVTSHKSSLRFKGKKKYRFKALLLQAWYYTKIAKHNAAYDYLSNCKTRLTIAQFDVIVLSLVEGHVLSNLERFKEALKCHGEARERLESLQHSLSDTDVYTSLAVSLYNMAADNCNLFQPKEAAPYIKAAGIVSSQHLPEGLVLREKINSLHEELLGSSVQNAAFKAEEEKQFEYRSASPPKERRANSRPPIFRKPEQIKSIETKGRSGFRKKSPASGRQRALKDGLRPASSSIGPVSPVASKSSSAKPHRRRNRVDTGYREAENLLKKKMEAMLQGDKDSPQPNKALTGLWKRSKETYPGLAKALKVRVARKQCAAVTAAGQRWSALKREYWRHRNVRELAVGLRSAANHRRKEMAIQQQIQWAESSIHSLARRLHSRCVKSALLTCLSACKRGTAATIRFGKLVYAYVAVCNKETTTAVKQSLRTALHRQQFHTVNRGAEVRDQTPGLSQLVISEGFSAPLYTEEWFSRADALLQRRWRPVLANSYAVWRHLTQQWRARLQYQRESRAAERIQCTYLSRLTRRMFLALRAVAVTVQRHWRSRRQAKRHRAVTVIQKAVRGFCARSRVCRCRDAATCIQKYYRGHADRRKIRKRERAIRRLQRAFRRYYRRPYMLQG